MLSDLGRRTVQKHGVVFDNVFQDVPNHILRRFFYGALCRFNVVALSAFYQPFHNERFEKFDCHFLRQTALINLQFRTYDDNRTTGIVYTLPSKF